MVTLISGSVQETQGFARKLGELISQGDVIGLSGPLGAGKTTFIQGLALGVGVPPQSVVRSPTFTLLHKYVGRYHLYHMDLYRLSSTFDVTEFQEYLGGDGACVIEWADRFSDRVPLSLSIEISIVDEETRCICLIPKNERAMILLDRLIEDK